MINAQEKLQEALQVIAELKDKNCELEKKHTESEQRLELAEQNVTRLSRSVTMFAALRARRHAPAEPALNLQLQYQVII